MAVPDPKYGTLLIYDKFSKSLLYDLKVFEEKNRAFIWKFESTQVESGSELAKCCLVIRIRNTNIFYCWTITGRKLRDIEGMYLKKIYFSGYYQDSEDPDGLGQQRQMTRKQEK